GGRDRPGRDRPRGRGSAAGSGGDRYRPRPRAARRRRRHGLTMTTKTRPRTVSAARPAPRAIDPRIRERRVAVLRAKGRRRLRWMIGVIVLAALAAAAWAVTHSSLLDVERIRVTGTQQATPRQVRLAARVKPGDAILFIDTGAIARRVERVAWVDKARVERSLGGEVDIHVTERRPVAWVRRAPDRVALVRRRRGGAPRPPPPPADRGRAPCPGPRPRARRRGPPRNDRRRARDPPAGTRPAHDAHLRRRRRGHPGAPRRARGAP